jgi:predicted RNA-binding protein with EMAP domain
MIKRWSCQFLERYAEDHDLRLEYYLKLAEQPARGRARAVHDAVLAVLSGAPEIAEIKRPG